MSRSGRSSRPSTTSTAYRSVYQKDSNDSVDFVNLEHKFKELMGYLSKPPLSYSNSVEEREKQRESVMYCIRAVIEVAFNESEICFKEERYKSAFQGALKTLHFIQDFHGTNSVQQIQVYFLLSKISQKMERYKEAEEFLSIAQWTLIKNPDCPHDLRAQLHQNFGLLYIQRGNLSKAVEHSATSVYYQALLHGTEHLVTSFGYFNLGNVFQTMGKLDAAIDFLKKVTQIWLIHLRDALENEKRKKKHVTEIEKLSDDDISKAGWMLELIRDVISEKYGEDTEETSQIFVVLGLFYWYVEDMEKAKENMEKAIRKMKYVLGDSHDRVLEIQMLLNDVLLFDDDDDDDVADDHHAAMNENGNENMSNEVEPLNLQAIHQQESPEKKEEEEEEIIDDDVGDVDEGEEEHEEEGEGELGEEEGEEEHEEEDGERNVL